MMTFWLIAALLTIGACLAVMSPFFGGGSTNNTKKHDIEVYRDQLAEVDRDAARAMISAYEAEEAKTEIGRRILKVADDSAADADSSTRLVAGRVVATFAILALPVLAVGGYALVGSPTMPDQALQTRLAADPAENSVEELVARAERHLAQNPDDGRGWDVLAPIYARVGRANEAVVAFQNTIRLNGTNAARESGLGEAIARAAGGMVSADAQAAMKRALAIDPGDAKARFYIALGLAQQGDVLQASADWRAMQVDLPQESPWRAAAAEAIERTRPASTIGPTDADVEAASGMSNDDRTAMIEAMIAQLDERLRDNPDDAEGWQRLVRSYVVLGRSEEAQSALMRGISGLGQGTNAAASLSQFAASLGIEQAASQ